MAHPDYDKEYRRHHVKLPDCCEINVSRHATLREKGLNIVGLDFLQMRSGAHYTHFLLNPPFSNGVKHVLKAWNLTFDAEIVAIINASTLLNPISAERQHLVRLIEENGDVEYIEDAFSVTTAEVKASVDVALIYLRKRANISESIIGPIIEDLKQDSSLDSIANAFKEAQELAIPNSTIENAVAAFNAAVTAMRDAVHSEARSKYYANLLGQTMAVSNGDMEISGHDATVSYVRNTISTRYDDLKNRAWTNILRSSKVTSKLSSKAQKRVEHEFEDIKKLDFSIQTIYGFICGIVESQGKIQGEMLLDIFDAISRYHTDNVTYFKGWKSNDKHRGIGYRVKSTRFILPGHATHSWSRSLSWESMQTLQDFDKCFSLLDGKYEPELGLVELCNSQYSELVQSKRLSSTYFDIRLYPGAGTLHFYPRRKDLVDRLNRYVGRLRNWIPDTPNQASDAFWKQFDNSEHFDKELRKELDQQHRGRSHWEHPLENLRYSSEDDDRHQLALDKISAALDTVLQRHGIVVDSLLTDQAPNGQLLLNAA